MVERDLQQQFKQLLSVAIMLLSIKCSLLLLIPAYSFLAVTSIHSRHITVQLIGQHASFHLLGWVQGSDGEWEWEEDDPTSVAVTLTSTLTPESIDATATPSLPGGSFRPKQSLGQNFLRDGNTVAKIVKAFVKDATETLGIMDGEKRDLKLSDLRAVELGPGAGALTDVLMPALGTDNLQCIEIDPRSVALLGEKHPTLRVHHLDVLQADYSSLADEEGGPLSIIGNLPYYITSQILFALADASHTNAIRSATVTMQWEVGKRIIAPTKCKDYGILSVVFQLYADCKIHFKIPPTVFYPQPKVDSALIGLHFLGPFQLRRRLAGVSPSNLRNVVTVTFQQRRKTVRNGLKQLALTVYGGDMKRVQHFFESEPLPLPESVREAINAGDEFALAQQLPSDWVKKRPEELSPGQFVELTRLLYGTTEAEESPLGKKVWRKLKHGTS
jgi:16S rRNA (adenine1518-N6/adenine1519-N6)-dimethyltransferase